MNIVEGSSFPSSTMLFLTFTNFMFADLCDGNTAKQQNYVIEPCELGDKVCVRACVFLTREKY